MLAVLVPQLLMTAAGIVLLAIGSDSYRIFFGVAVLAFCTTAVTGYILVSIFVGKGASLARLQNDFFSSASHELRTPITAINLLLEPLATGKLAGEERQQVATLLSREVARLDHLLVRTLDLSRMQSGRHAFAMLPVRVDELVAEAIAAFDVATLGRPTKIGLDLAPDLSVRGDRETLVRAVANLLHNAWKYTGDDKQIRVVARPYVRKVQISVIDNGIGIDPAERHELFDGFVRGKAAVDSRIPGVGLGLAIVRTIVRAHKGKIEVESAPGHGSVFRVILPRAQPLELATGGLPPAVPA